MVFFYGLYIASRSEQICAREGAKVGRVATPCVAGSAGDDSRLSATGVQGC